MTKYTWFHTLQVRPAHAGDGLALAPLLRAQDRAELAATHPGQDVGECLERFVAVSDVSVCVSHQGEVFVLAGVYREATLPSPCIVWMLTGEGVRKHPIRFFKLSQFFLDQWLAYYGTLFNYIDARYTSACALAKRLGGQLENDNTYYQGKLFLKCIFRRNLWEE